MQYSGMRVLVHLAFGLALCAPASGLAQSPKDPERPSTERRQPLTRELEKLERELEQTADSIRKTAREVEKTAKGEAEKALPELRESLGELRRGLEAAIEDLDEAIEQRNRPAIEGTISGLWGHTLELKGVKDGTSTVELDEQTLVRRDGSRL